MGKLAKNRVVSRRRWTYGLVFLLLLLGALVLNAPLSLANRFLPENSRLLNPSGNIHHGRWQNIQINGKTYPLACNYRRQSLHFSAMTYRLQCDTPFSLEATLTLQFNGDATLSDTVLSGNLSEARPWLQLLGVPGNLSGDIAISIDNAKLEKRTLTYLSVRGNTRHLALFNTPLIDRLRITTLSPALSSTRPIELEIRTPPEDDNIADNPVRVYLTSDIDGKNYHTSGEISGTLLGQYAPILRFFGQQTGANRFAVQMQGRLL